jgi:hypothetical protein
MIAMIDGMLDELVGVPATGPVRRASSQRSGSSSSCVTSTSRE